MKNRNLGRFHARLAFEEWDGFEAGTGKSDFFIKVSDRDSNCDVYVFEPSLPGEAWNILILKYSGSVGLSPALKAQVDQLSNQLEAMVEESFGD